MRYLLLALALSMAPFAQSEDESVIDLAAKLDKPLVARTTQGIVRDVNFEKRQIIVSGYKYDFGPPGIPIEVSMEGGSQGAFELLSPGMKVEIMYGDLGATRLPLSVKVISPDATLEF